MSWGKVNLNTSPKIYVDKGESCYPFIEKNNYTKPKVIGESRRRNVYDYHLIYETIHDITENKDSCRRNGVCFCSDKVFGDSKYRHPLSCNVDVEINSFDSCQLDITSPSSGSK